MKINVSVDLTLDDKAVEAAMSILQLTDPEKFKKWFIQEYVKETAKVFNTTYADNWGA